MKNKIRYAMRNQMEDIIKSKHIHQDIFHEASKFHWHKIIKKLYYTFFNYYNSSHAYLCKNSSKEQWHSPTDKSDFSGWYPYMWLNIRKDLPVSHSIYECEWEEYMKNILDMIPQRNDRTFYYLLTDGGWLYEGTLPAIVQVLSDYPISMEEFYLFPKDYSWLITHSDDAGCMVKRIYQRGER